MGVQPAHAPLRITLLATPDTIHTRRWIAWLAARGHAITLVTDAYTRHRPPDCRILFPRWNFATKLLAFRLTPRPYGNERWKHLHMAPLVRASNPDVVHGFETLHYGLATALAGPYPRVLTPWGRDIHFKAGEHPLAHKIVSRALRGVDAISTNDETLASYLEKHFGIDPAKVRAFSWGVDLQVFKPGLVAEAARWRQELNIPVGAPVIFSPRHFLPYWGSDLLCGAIPEVLSKTPGAVFVILRGLTNEAVDQTPLRDLERAGFGAQLRFIERGVEPHEMAALFNMARAFVSVPRTDLLAQSVLEGMACGCLPVLADHAAYRKHALVEARGEGENSLTLKQYTSAALAAALTAALRDDALAARAAAENPARMARMENWEVNAAQMEDVYALARERFAAGNAA